MAVFVLDKRNKPLMPCCEKRSGLLLTPGRAVVHPRHPFTVSLQDRVGGDVQPVLVKIDPGTRTTGVAIITGESGHRAAINVGRVAIRASGSVRAGNGDGINAKYGQLLHRAERYGYAWRPGLPLPAEAGGLQRGSFG